MFRSNVAKKYTIADTITHTIYESGDRPNPLDPFSGENLTRIIEREETADAAISTEFSNANKIEAIIHRETIDEGLTYLKGIEDFKSMKKTYNSIRTLLKKNNNNLTDDEAASLINYALHN